MEKIILCGYMASGKTTTAHLLAKASGLPYIDLDEVLETVSGKSISELFEAVGEIKFRKMEHDALTSIVNRSEGFVLSLGGGTPCYANNHLVLERDDVVSIYLKVAIPELGRRIRLQEGKRPLVKKLGDDELDEFIAKHLFERSYFYHKAKHVLSADGKTPEQMINEIMSLY